MRTIVHFTCLIILLNSTLFSTLSFAATEVRGARAQGIYNALKITSDSSTGAKAVGGLTCNTAPEPICILGDPQDGFAIYIALDVEEKIDWHSVSEGGPVPNGTDLDVSI